MAEISTGLAVFTENEHWGVIFAGNDSKVKKSALGSFRSIRIYEELTQEYHFHLDYQIY